MGGKKKTNSPWAKHWARRGQIVHRKIYKWQLSVQKDAQHYS